MGVYDNPRVTFVYGTPYGSPPACINCHKPVDPTVGYFALWTGTARRPDLVAVAHGSLWEGPGEDDCCPWCEDLLRRRWHELLGQVGAGILEQASVEDEWCWFLRGRRLEPGTHLELLTADGTWVPGWLTDRRDSAEAPRFCFGVAGWDAGCALLTLLPDTVVRVPRDSVHP